MRFAPFLLLALLGCNKQPGFLRDTSGTIWDWSCGAVQCTGVPEVDAGTPTCDYAYGSAGARLFLLCGGPVEASGIWDLDPLSCRATVCLRDSDCPSIGGGRVLLCTGGLCEDHDEFPTPSTAEEADALCLADVPRPPPCSDVSADPATRSAVAVLDGGCTGPCTTPPSCRQP